MVGSERHVIYEPEWVIEASGRGGFRVECECGWEKSGFDTITRARSAAFDHSASGAALMPDRPSQEQRGAARGDEGEPKRKLSRFWRR